MFNTDANADNSELNDAQKIKIMNTLSEFILLNKHQKPIIFTKDGQINNKPVINNLKQNYGLIKSSTVYVYILTLIVLIQLRIRLSTTNQRLDQVQD
jgi:hypothetical protein